ncbi:hypothetical protein ACFSVM_21400 [Paenibacillus shunpengii]|uniref:Uncharacterized protein n=1 Tax=Paenibacillus shunpengii TaxID=2054424 RepID=A0ABW5STU8_9BACL
MKCGARRYVVVIDTEENEFKEIIVKARTAIEARKVIRKQYGPKIKITSVSLLNQEQEGHVL